MLVDRILLISCHSIRVDRLLGGKGWISGEVSEICGISGIGKTTMCLNSMIAMLVQEELSQAIWIETVDHEFSAQRASDIAKVYILRQKECQEQQESGDENDIIEV
jgi:RecA/RadA recombinase